MEKFPLINLPCHSKLSVCLRVPFQWFIFTCICIFVFFSQKNKKILIIRIFSLIIESNLSWKSFWKEKWFNISCKIKAIVCLYMPSYYFYRNFHHLKLLLGNKKVLMKHTNKFHHDDWFLYVKCFIIIFVTSINITTCCNFTHFVILAHTSWYIECPQVFIICVHINIKDNLSQYKKVYCH